MEIEIPRPVLDVMERLDRAGYEVYAVGGCVRDMLMEKTPSDWDLTTDALPEEIHRALEGMTVNDTGLKHGTVTVISQHIPVEVTTYRVDGSYSDHRRPDAVTFTRELREDLARRDFTVNAMVYHPRTGVRDFFGGMSDVEDGVLRAVGDPEKRFQEDALRILRGLRFAATLGFSIEGETARAMVHNRYLLEEIAPERVREELCKLLMGDNAVPVLRAFREIFAVILPEIVPMFDFDQQNRHHIYDVWEHTLHTLAVCEKSGDAEDDFVLRMVMLLHDCAKPERFSRDFRGHGHFYGHAARGAEIAQGAMGRLRFDNDTADRVVRLISLHDSDILDTEKSLLRWLRKIGERDLRLLLRIKVADNLGQNPKFLRVDGILQTGRDLEALLLREPCFDRSRLTVKGGDLMEIGLSGAAIGEALDELVEAVIEGSVKNEKQALLEWCKRNDK